MVSGTPSGETAASVDGAWDHPLAKGADMRGDFRFNDQLEQLEFAYLYAVAAAAGCSIFDSKYDDGIDAIVKHRHPLHATGANGSVDAFLQIQLKCISTVGPNPTSGKVSRSFDNDRFALWAEPNPSMKKIVVIMLAPPDLNDWIASSHEALTLRHCAYWCSIAGQETTGAKTSQVTALTANIFNDIALCKMMHKIGQVGQGGKL